MWQPYVDLAKTFFPNATIIVDKYHFIRQVSWAIDSVHKRLQRSMTPTLKKYYKRSRKLILTRYSKLKDENKKACDLMLLYNDDLRLAHRLKEWFYEICQSNSYTYQRSSFGEWVKNAESSGLYEFVACAKTYRHWSQYILNAFKYGYTNGPTEGFNNKIKVLKKVHTVYVTLKDFVPVLFTALCKKMVSFNRFICHAIKPLLWTQSIKMALLSVFIRMQRISHPNT